MIKLIIGLLVLALVVNVSINTYKDIQVNNNAVAKAQVKACSLNNFKGWVKVKGAMTTFNCSEAK